MASPQTSVGTPHAGSPPVSTSLKIALPPASAQISQPGSAGSPSTNLQPAQSIESADSPGESKLNCAPYGPASREYKIPPRAKPGRKPKVETNDQHRREQNKNAQKKFRAKQADKIKDLSDELEKMNARMKQIEAARQQLQRVVDETRAHLHTALNDKEAYKRRAEELEEDMRSAKRIRITATTEKEDSNSVPLSASSMLDPARHGPTPPNEADEIDFTNFGKTMPDNCGFCDGGDFCACKEAANLNPIPVPPPTEAQHAAIAPGSCDVCQRDPEQARKCRELAAAAQFSPAPEMAVKKDPATTLAPNVTLPSFAEIERTSCSDFLARVKPGSDEAYKRVLGRMHAYPYAERPGRETPGSHKPAMDLDAAEAAEALTMFANGNGKPS
ncbi:transcription factor-like protein 4 [Elsinoe australis]|uniref:Transcription factor-like protein 4 n=1 Tax=Elsinoe australis TaxID=40998 RepID=A0A4U7B9V4_9PEZI|nr:transcription factor-like protein 4 [Elsinoe australis]